MKVTIITPSLNSERHILYNIKSVLSQTYKHVEHIVIDGGSSDGTVGILQAHSHLKWVSQPDQGMYDAINKGIRQASGDIIAYLNVDDRYFLNTVQTIVDVFQKDDTIDFVYGDCEYIDENGSVLFTNHPLPYFWAKSSLDLLWCQPSWFWRRRIHDEIGLFDARLKYVGDAEFMRRCVVRELKGHYVKNTLSQFMFRRDCLSIKGREVCERERLAIRKEYGVDAWSLNRIAAETLFAIKNINSYQHRLRFHKLRYDQINGAGAC